MTLPIHKNLNFLFIYMCEFMWSVYAQIHTIPILIITAKCLHVMQSYLNVIPFFGFTNLAE